MSRLQREVELLFLFAVICLTVGCNRKTGEPDFSESKAFADAVCIADHKVSEGHWAVAKHIVDSSFYAIPGKTVRDSFVYYRFHYELYYRSYKNSRLAFLYTDSVKRLLERHDAYRAMASEFALIYYWRGDIYFASGDYEEAYEEYYKGREVGKKVLDECGISDYSYRLGMVLYQQERYQESKEHFLSSLSSQSHCANNFILVYRKQEVLDNIGLCYYELKQYDSAAFYYNLALATVDQELENGSEHQKKLQGAARAVILGNLASVYEDLGDFEKAESCYKESIQTNKEIHLEHRDLLVTNLKLARYYHRRDDDAKMLAVLREEQEMLQETPNAEVEMDWHYLMSQYYNEKNPAVALSHLSKYNRLKDSLDAIAKEFRSYDIKEHIQNLEKERKLSMLQESFARKNMYLIVAVAIAAVCLLGILLIIYYVKKLRIYLRRLAQLNEKVNDHKRALESALSKLEISNKEKDKILRVVAHDLRSPITAIYSLADLLSSDPAIGQEQKEIVDLIKTASNNSLTLSREILDTAVMQSEEYKAKCLNFAELVSHNVELLKFRAAEKQQVIDLRVEQTYMEALVDSDKFSRVIGNIITNAIKFSKEGARIKVDLYTSAEDIYLTVKDEGIGIPDSIKEKVFEMFTEAKREGTSGEKPYGLGLSIARQIVERHNGRIWFESVVGEGTTFFITIPQSETPSMKSSGHSVAVAGC